MPSPLVELLLIGLLAGLLIGSLVGVWLGSLLTRSHFAAGARHQRNTEHLNTVRQSGTLQRYHEPLY